MRRLDALPTDKLVIFFISVDRELKANAGVKIVSGGLLRPVIFALLDFFLFDNWLLRSRLL